MKLACQCLAYIVFFGLVGLLSIQPPLRLLGDDEAVISITFSYAGKRIGECRRLSPEALEALPPNMRKPDECPRERHPLRVQLLLDERLLYEELLPPSGVWADGKSTAYRRLRVPSGLHTIDVRMNDSGTDDTYDFERASNIELLPGQNLAVFFDQGAQDFEFQ